MIRQGIQGFSGPIIVKCFCHHKERSHKGRGSGLFSKIKEEKAVAIVIYKWPLIAKQAMTLTSCTVYFN